MKKTCIVYLVLLSLISCTQHEPGTHSVVTGRLAGGGGEMALLEELKAERTLPVDSVILDKQGNFRLKARPEETGFYLLRLAERDPVFMVLEGGDTLELRMDTSSFDLTYMVSGNLSSRLLMNYHRKTGETQHTIDSLRNVLFEKQGDPGFSGIKFAIDSTLESALAQHREFTEMLIRKNPGELASLLMINFALAGQPVFNPENDAELYFLINDSLLERYPENSHVMAHARRMEELRKTKFAAEETAARVEIGKQIPQIKLPDTGGIPTSLASLEGYPVVLFFWASWSPESRADLQLLKQLDEHFRDAGLRVYAVSLDHNQKYWKAAVNAEALTWINVIDEGGLNGATSKLFHLQRQLPYYFLVDKNGVITNKTADFGVLEQAVKELADDRNER